MLKPTEETVRDGETACVGKQNLFSWLNTTPPHIKEMPRSPTIIFLFSFKFHN